MKQIRKLTVAQINQALDDSGYQLQQSPQGLWQLHSADDKLKPLLIDFVTGKSRHRRLYGGGIQQPLAKAVGIKKQIRPSVLDVTAGLGRDAFVLATLGCQVTMNERVSAIAFLLHQAMQQAQEDAETAKIIANLSLRVGDSLDLLQELPKGQFDCIYLDPMYPHREKTALVKKEMRIFRDLAGDDNDSALLLTAARRLAGKRVVVKRPKGGEYLGGLAGDFQIKSPNTRYDIYLNSYETT